AVDAEQHAPINILALQGQANVGRGDRCVKLDDIAIFAGEIRDHDAIRAEAGREAIGVVARIAEHQVVAGSADQDVVPGAGEYFVVAGSSNDDFVAVAAFDAVVEGASGERLIGLVTLDQVAWQFDGIGNELLASPDRAVVETYFIDA